MKAQQTRHSRRLHSPRRATVERPPGRVAAAILAALACGTVAGGTAGFGTVAFGTVATASAGAGPAGAAAEVVGGAGAAGLRSIVERGGPVMWPLLILSVIAVALVLERTWFWATSHRPARARGFSALMVALRTGRGDAASLAAQEGGLYGTVASRVLRDGAGEGAGLEAVEAVRPRIDRSMNLLSTIITAAPLIGILGTVVGIIQSFDLLGSADATRDPSTVAAGIATALLTTAAGLVVALIALFPYMVFRGQVERALSRLDALLAAGREGASAGIAAPAAKSPPPTAGS
ncbi:MAG: MotA/TolQ/ExbB proton channel family protein [Phycisphaerales bacterium]